jgi:Transglycosylase SLT domain
VRFRSSGFVVSSAVLAVVAVAATVSVVGFGRHGRPASRGKASKPTASAVYFGTLPSGTTGLPNSDSVCAAKVAPSAWEPRPDNTAANNLVPAHPATISWARNQGNLHWKGWIANRDKVTGNYKGTTSQIFQWAACKWGVDEDVLRAVGAQESGWHQDAVGDVADGAPHSFGIMQVRNTSDVGGPAWGGYPQTLKDTSLNIDFYAAYIRSCLDGDFYDGGPWLYDGQTVEKEIAADGANYVLWGCVGSWFSGHWYDALAQTYVAHVRHRLEEKAWLSYG